MNIFIPFSKYNTLKICESLKDDILYKKMVISEASIQKYHSTSTNANFIANGVKYGLQNNIFKAGIENLDIGSGKFMGVSKTLKKNGVFNIMYDPFLQSSSQNQKVVQWLKMKKTQTATVNNVLNVIAEDEIALNTINQAARGIADGGVAIFTICEGNKSGEGAPTGSDGFQRNKQTADYVPMVEQYFGNVSTASNVIIAHDQKDIEKAFWPFDASLDHGASL